MVDFKRKIKNNFLKFLFDYKKRENFKIEEINKVLFCQHSDKIGDSIANTHVFRELKRQYPRIKIEVLCGKNNIKILENNPNIDKIILYNNILTFIEIRKNNYDLLYFHNEEINQLSDYLLMKIVDAKLNVGRNKSEFKIIDKSIDGNFSEVREIDKYNAFLKIFNIKPREEKYDIFLSEEEIESTEGYIIKNRKNIVFNRYGANKRRTFNKEKTEEIIETINKVCPDSNIILIGPPSKNEELLDLKDKFQNAKITVPSIKNIRASASIIYNSDLIITPETSIVHIACAFRKPQISIYRRKDILWHPITNEATIVYSKNKNKKDVNCIDMEEFKKVFSDKIKEL